MTMRKRIETDPYPNLPLSGPAQELKQHRRSLFVSSARLGLSASPNPQVARAKEGLDSLETKIRGKAWDGVV